MFLVWLIVNVFLLSNGRSALEEVKEVKSEISKYTLVKEQIIGALGWVK